MKNYPLYEHQCYSTLKELLHACAQKHGERPAFRYAKGKEDVTVTYAGFLGDVQALGTCLFARGYRGAHIAVFGGNCYEWILTHFAATCGGNVIVPLDKELHAPEMAKLIQDSESTLVFYAHAYADIAKAIEEMTLPGVTLCSMKDIPAMLAEGQALMADGNREYIDAAVAKDDLATIVYTSGTTGVSKGVMLSHFNLTSDAHGACCNVLNVGPTLLLLPLHHTFGFTAAILAVMMYGNSIYINQSLKRISADIKKSSPQMIFIVPLILKTLHNTIWNTARQQKKEKALRILARISNALYAVGIDVRRKLMKPVLESFGGNLDTLVCGGAPMEEKYVDAFRPFGITMLNGYGITECSPIVAVNRNRFAVPGSVGLPLPCNEVKIAEDGEVLVRGSNVMQGYYHMDAENARVFTDGWFHTGDIGKIDKHGALHITGRIKNLIILGNGENIAAESIEEAVYTIPYVKETIAYGEDNVIVAEVYLDEETPDAQTRIHQDIQALNRQLPLNKNIGRVVVRDREFEKTTTKKIKRNYGGQKNA